MLGRNSYPSDYVAACRARVDAQLAAFRAVVAAVPKKSTAAVAELETQLCAGLVVELDAMFVHRVRSKEGKDGNPMNEVRMLSASILEHDADLAADKTIKWKPESSVLGLAIGDSISLHADDFERLAAAYFDAIDATFA